MKSKVLILAMSLLVFAFGCGRKEEKAHETPKGPSVKVAVSRADKGDMPVFIESVGSVKASREAVVASKVMGSISKLNFKEGDRVKEGSVLVEIDDREIRAQLQQAEAAVAEAVAAYKNSEINIHRMKNLLEQKSVTQQQYDNASMQHDMARARVQQTHANMEAVKVSLGYAKVAAPFDGVVTEKLIEKGEMAAPGRQLFKITDDGAMTFDTEIREAEIKGVRSGKVMDVRIDAVDKTIKGKVSRVIPSGDQATHSFLVKIGIPKTGGIMPGMFGKAVIGKDSVKAIFVPKIAVVEKGQLVGVYVVRDGKVQFRVVKTGMVSREKVEVLSGVTEGEEVAMSNLEGLSDGSRVEIQK